MQGAYQYAHQLSNNYLTRYNLIEQGEIKTSKKRKRKKYMKSFDR